MKKPKLSVVIITKNEEKIIEDCIKTISWADEVIVIDSVSLDKTVEKAKKLGVKIYKRDFKYFDERRNFGLKRAQGDWLLYVDADERVSLKLKQEILEKINNPQNFDAFKIPRLNIFFGKPMKYGGWYPDYQTRLFKKDKLAYWFGPIHESPKVKGKTGKLTNHLIHLTHLSITKGFEKSVNWTQIEADLLFKANHPPLTVFHLIKVTLAEFLKRVFLKRGFKDGPVGWLEGMIQAYNKFLVYAQLWEKQQSCCQ